MSESESRGAVHFRSTPEIVQIPRRSAWRRKWKPIKDKCCSTCCALVYVFCFPCIRFVQSCWNLCNPFSGDDSSHSVNTSNTSDRRNTYNLYPRVEPSQSLTNIPYTSNLPGAIKPPPPQLM